MGFPDARPADEPAVTKRGSDATAGPAGVNPDLHSLLLGDTYMPTANKGFTGDQQAQFQQADWFSDFFWDHIWGESAPRKPSFCDRLRCAIRAFRFPNRI
jgi:hypothetical protein